MAGGVAGGQFEDSTGKGPETVALAYVRPPEIVPVLLDLLALVCEEGGVGGASSRGSVGGGLGIVVLAQEGTPGIVPVLLDLLTHH